MEWKNLIDLETFEENDFDFKDLEHVNELLVCGETPLHIAVLKNFPILLKQLLHISAEVIQMNSSGNCPHHLACQLGNFECLKILREHGNCDLSLPNLNGNLPSDICKEEPSEIDVYRLLEYISYDPRRKERFSTHEISTGRLQCLEYINSQLSIQLEQSETNYFRDLLATNESHLYTRRILSGDSNEHPQMFSSFFYRPVGHSLPIRTVLDPLSTSLHDPTNKALPFESSPSSLTSHLPVTSETLLSHLPHEDYFSPSSGYPQTVPIVVTRLMAVDTASHVIEQGKTLSTVGNKKKFN